MPRYADIAYATEAQAAGEAAGFGLWTPQRQGLAAWTMDPNTAQVNGIPTVGKVALMPFIPPADAAVTQLLMGIQAAAVTPTAGQCFGGIYDQLGNLLGLSADISGSLTSTGLLTVTLTTTVNIKAGALYYAALLQNAATGATFRQGLNSSAVGNAPNARFLQTSASGLTALPNPLGAVVSAGVSLYVGVK